MTIFGFIDNQSYDKGAEQLSEERGIDSKLIRIDMISSLLKRLGEKGIPCFGPVASMKYPVGGFFFKLQMSAEEKNLKKYVLEQLGLDDSQIMPIDGYKSANINLGLIVKDYPNVEYSDEIDPLGDILSNFATLVQSARPNKQEDPTKPYFTTLDE